MNSLPYEISGNPNSNNLVIFLHGWPDSIRLWDGVIKGLDSDSYKLAISYPNYSKDEKSKWGIDIPQLIQRIKFTIDKIDDGKNRNKILVGHDWGSIFWFNIITFLLPGIIGNPIHRQFTQKFIRHPYQNNENSASMNYLYLYLWKGIFTSICKKKKGFEGYNPSCPLSYMYATDKLFQFHNDKFLNKLKENKQNDVYPVKGGHWVFILHTDLIIQIIQGRLLSFNKNIK